VTGLGSKDIALVAEAVEVVLAPLKLLVYGFAELEQLFLPMVAERYNAIPEHRRLRPPLAIAGPTIEAAKYATEQPEICALLANVLVSSMDAATSGSVHPAFIDIIKQLTTDEAKILKQMGRSPLVSVRKEVESLESVVILCQAPALEVRYVDIEEPLPV
jgi:hypothetical protein